MGRNDLSEVPLKDALRIVVDHEGSLRRVATVSWSNRDTSLYITPHGSNALGYAGLERDIGHGSWTIDFTKQLATSGSRMLLGVSLHESGQVHAKCGLGRTDSVHGPPLVVGDHVASVICTDYSSLPMWSRQATPDVVLQHGDEYLGKLVVGLFTSTARSDLPDSSRLFLRLKRPGLPVLEVGITIRGEDIAVTGDDQSGVIVIAGWGAGRSQDVPGDLVYAVAR